MAKQKVARNINVAMNQELEILLSELASLLGLGRATILKLLLREYGPAKIAELRAKCQENYSVFGKKSGQENVNSLSQPAKSD